jgi:dephospho-CoA kinase
VAGNRGAGTLTRAGPAGERRDRSLRIGLTGPIGCGKSTVAGMLRDLGVVVLDADQIAHRVTAAGEQAHSAILARFGDAVRAPDGSLDRGALAAIVFDDPVQLATLEAIVHPVVRRVLLAELESADSAGTPVVAVEAIRLVEGGLASLCDEVWLIVCGPDTQRDRLRERGVRPEDAERRIAAQRGLADRAAAIANRTIRTDGTLDDVRAATRRALESAVRRPRPRAAVAPPTTGGA